MTNEEKVVAYLDKSSIAPDEFSVWSVSMKKYVDDQYVRVLFGHFLSSFQDVVEYAFDKDFNVETDRIRQVVINEIPKNYNQQKKDLESSLDKTRARESFLKEQLCELQIIALDPKEMRKTDEF
jgi:hypothetical protein